MHEPRVPFFRRRRVRRFALYFGLPALAAGAFFVPRAMAGGPGFGGCHGPGHGHHGPMHADSAADLQEHMQHRLDRMLDRLDATDAQRAQARAVVKTAAPELFALQEQGRELRGQLKRALTAEQVDQAKVATLAQEVDATLGQAARVGIEAVGQVAAVLEPAQRQQVADFLARFDH